MRFRNDENLKIVAAAKQAAPEVVAVELAARMQETGMIEDPDDAWCKSVAVATEDKYVADVCGVLAGFLYGDETRSIPAGVFDAFCALIVIGDGGCPYCGGDLEFVEEVGHEIRDGDYWMPNSWIHEYDLYKCGECYKYVKN